MIKEFFKWFEHQFAFLQGNMWIAEVFIVVLVAGICNYAISIAYRRIHPRLQKSHNIWDNSTAKAIYKPAALLVWIFGISLAAEIISEHGKYTGLIDKIPEARSLGIVVLLGWFLIRLVGEVEKNILQPPGGKIPPDKTTVHAIGKLVRMSVIITSVLIGLQTFGIGISGLLAFGGIGGAAVAFSAKDLLANFFGGLIIYLDRPFAVGDWIRSPDRNIEGTVENIGWRLCRIRTFDKRPLYVPNGIFNSISVENPSRMTNRRIKTSSAAFSLQ